MKKRILLFAAISLTAFSLACTTANTKSSGNTTVSNAANVGVNQTQAEVNAPPIANQTNTTETTAPAISTEVPNYTDANAAFTDGKKFFEDNENENAVKALEQAVKLDANHAEAHLWLGFAYEVLEETSTTPVGEATPAKRSSKSSSKNKKDAPQTASQKSYNNAIKAYEKFLNKNPKDAAAHFNLGRAYKKINEDQKAEKALRQAIKLEPEDSEFHYELGVVLNKLAQYEEAIKALKESLKLEPDNGRAERELDRAQAGKKRVDAAKPKDKPPVK